MKKSTVIAGEEKLEGVLCLHDTNDFWISRINKGYNEEYEKDECNISSIEK